MNFGDILDKWEKQRPSGGDVSDGDFQAKDTEERSKQSGAQEKRRRLRNKRPDAELDIHGQTRDAAWQALETFFNTAKEKELEKVLIIHGKGNHSVDEPVLKRVVMDFIERCPFAGESGRGKASAGGDGATWVLLKELREEIA
jgi:DNA-nicking Smr family endonuclease